jgi:hypothetical protein
MNKKYLPIGVNFAPIFLAICIFEFFSIAYIVYARNISGLILMKGANKWNF